MAGKNAARRLVECDERPAYFRGFEHEARQRIGQPQLRCHQASGMVYTLSGIAEFLSNSVPASTPALATSSAVFSLE